MPVLFLILLSLQLSRVGGFCIFVRFLAVVGPVLVTKCFNFTNLTLELMMRYSSWLYNKTIITVSYYYSFWSRITNYSNSCLRSQAVGYC